MKDVNLPYYVPSKSYWPILGSIGLTTTMLGAASWLHEKSYGFYLFMLGSLIMAFMLFGWFRDVIIESRQNLYSPQMDRSFRWGMAWFIFSEVMFFAAFFGALYYARCLSVPWLGGQGDKSIAHTLWPNFKAVWPLLISPDSNAFVKIKHVINPWGLPILNTGLLLSSGVTLTLAHHALQKNKRLILNLFLLLTIILGLIFMTCQVMEYQEAYSEEMQLTLKSGIYGTTFFMLTGFHGAHVCIGTLMMIILCGRCFKGHFTPEKHFAFEAVAWYWHFVDIVWLILFVFVYWI